MIAHQISSGCTKKWQKVAWKNGNRRWADRHTDSDASVIGFRFYLCVRNSKNYQISHDNITVHSIKSVMKNPIKKKEK